MASGRREQYRDSEYPDFEYDRSRNADRRGYDGAKVRVLKRGLHDRVTVRKDDIRTRDIINSGVHHYASNMGDPVRRVGQESGKRSSEYGSDLATDSKSHDELPKLENGNKSLVESKKRKFSPIVWDRDDKDTRVVSMSRASPSTALPPPPALPKVYREESNIIANGCGQISPLIDNDLQTLESSVDPDPDHVEVGTYVSTVSGAPIDVSSPSKLQRSDNNSNSELLENRDYVPTGNILSSRWAGDGDSPADEGEIADDEDMYRRRKMSVDRSVETREYNKSMTPVLDRSRGRFSGSDEDGVNVRYSSKDDYSADDGDSAALLHTDLDNEHDMRRTPEPEAPAHRNIGMIQDCRSVDEYERLNRISEGTYGIVYRAEDKKTGEIVALKKVKMEREREGFPLTALREMNILLSFHHPAIVDVKEVVMGGLEQIFMVMEYMEHDVKALMEAMKQPFSQREVKCLMLQLLEGVKYLHDNWVLHRDLKTSNLLLNNQGDLKICDFGMARQYGSPLKPYTHLVVTLWYRAPELLLGAKEYSTAVDMWSVGCIMAELLSKEPLFNGEKEIDQLDKIFKMLGTPNETVWPGFSKLPGVKVKFVKHQHNQLRKKFRTTTFTGSPVLSDAGLDLLNKLLTYDPEKRITAEDALNHDWFREVPLPKSKEFMPTFPAQNAHDRRLRRKMKSPDPLEEQRRKELQEGEVGTRGLFG